MRTYQQQIADLAIANLCDEIDPQHLGPAGRIAGVPTRVERLLSASAFELETAEFFDDAATGREFE